ncbi:MAG: hypothetical protein P8178_15590 [Candidatus Thiodiazotropha sp.]
MQQGKHHRLLTFLALAFLSMTAVAADTPSGEAPASAATAQTKTAEQNVETRYSLKCGIYSGICPLVTPMKVGDYCVCATPSGPIHGVVVP